MSININSSDVIGEGGYGCIHKPSLICNNNKKIIYKNKVSKLLLTEHAIGELKEYMLISETDKKNEYFLGIPDLCTIKTTKIAMKSVQKCRKLIKKNNNKPITKKNLQRYSLLIMNFGGTDLEKFGVVCGKFTDTPKNKAIITNFWKETKRILQGISLFQKHDIVHFDLKPHNIVYNRKTARLNFIDFGHMRKIGEAMESSRQSTSGITSEAFWNYPFEIQFLNKDSFMNVAYLSRDQRQAWFDDFINSLKTHADTHFVIAYETFIDMYTENLSIEETQDINNNYQEDLLNMLLNGITVEKYEPFLEKSMKTIDTYGIGLTFMYMLNYTRHLLPEQFVKKMSELCYFITTPDLSKRYTIDTIVEEHANLIALI